MNPALTIEDMVISAASIYAPTRSRISPVKFPEYTSSAPVSHGRSRENTPLSVAQVWITVCEEHRKFRPE